ncbi:MAG: hypothetical protein WBN08_18605 [Thiogranum sp.]
MIRLSNRNIGIAGCGPDSVNGIQENLSRIFPRMLLCAIRGVLLV